MARYLTQHHGRGWYVVLDVPKALRPVVGKRRLLQSLGTDSLTVAERRVHAVIAEWKARFEDARRMDPLSEEAERWRLSFAEASAKGDGGPDDDSTAGHGDELERRYEAIKREQGEASANRFLRRATAGADLIDPLWARWIGEKRYSGKTLLSVAQAKALLLKSYSAAREVSRREAATFVTEVLSPGRKPASINKLLSHIRGFWEWLHREGIVEGENPWSRLRRAEGGRRGEPKERRTPMPEREGAAMIASVDAKAAKRPDEHPADPHVLRLVAVTGMRLEEACSLTSKDVEERGKVLFVHVRDGKTKAAARRVPVVVPEVAVMLRQRAKGGGLLFPELTPDLRGDRAPRISQRIGRVLRTITKDKALVAAHSWRHRAATRMEEGGVPFPTIEAFLGHKRQGESAGRYSAGPSDAQLIEAARCITLPFFKERLKAR